MPIKRGLALVVSISVQSLLIAVGGVGTAAEAAPIGVFRDFASFSAANSNLAVSTFDALALGTSLGNPASVGGALISHGDPSSEFTVFSSPYIPVSPPHVLAPFTRDVHALAFGDTTLSFGPDTQAAGLFLVVGQGFNSEARLISTVTVLDRSGESEMVLVEFQGQVGESRFIGFSSPDDLESIRFTVADQIDGGSQSSVAMDNLAIATTCQNACSAATPTVVTLRPPDHRWVEVGIHGVLDSEGEPLAITITSIRQDEPVNGTGDGNFAPDGQGVGSATARLRAERAGKGNGRVYHIGFSATDTQGCGCSGTVTVTVPRDQSGRPAIDEGPLYDSTAM